MLTMHRPEAPSRQAVVGVSRVLTCEWCTTVFRRTNTHGWRKYCDHRCCQAAQDYRRRGVGTPGVRPKEMGFVMRVYRNGRKAAA